MRGHSALVFANRADQDAGLVGERLREHGYELTLALREEPGRIPDPADHDLVLSLGSAWSAYWEAVEAAVARECAALRQAAAAGQPVLGICFGSHLLAKALGGDVVRASELEVGWLAVQTDDAEVVGAGPWFQWHGDRWTAPPGARVVARSRVCDQAFTTGRVLAVQFHPEVTPEIVERWTREDPASLATAGLEADAVVAESRACAAETRSRAGALVDAFLERSFSAAPGAAGH